MPTCASMYKLFFVAMFWSGALAVPAVAAPLLSYEDARHLLNRTGFGATDEEIRRLVGMTREDAASSLLGTARTVAITAPPAWTADGGPLRYPRGETASEIERRQFRQEQVRKGLELRGWWLSEMLATPSPLTERMTLFWHNHFVSGQQKVRLADLMYRQNVTLRAHALGNFGTLLHAVARDPAMVVYLDSAQNRRAAPNENFARELMELFTLGEGNYGEGDVKEAARAFTGWSLDRDTGRFVFRRLIHDYGTKTVLGRSGNLDGDDVLDVLLAQPQTAEFITRKLWREFVSPDPEDEEVRRIAARFRDSRYDIKIALHDLLTSKAFYASANRGTLIKSPVDLVVGTLRQFGLKPRETVPFAIAAATMGQNLFAPPNVKGWPGGEAWINASTLLARKAFLDRVFRAENALSSFAAEGPSAMMDAPEQTPAGSVDESEAARRIRLMRAMHQGLRSVRFDSAAWLSAVDDKERSRADTAMRLLLAYPPQTVPEASTPPLALVRQIVLDAAYQLK